jgi:hypothetical protein
VPAGDHMTVGFRQIDSEGESSVALRATAGGASSQVQLEGSCENCLRHYHNQHLKERLDRKLGVQLLRYAFFGQAPAEAPIQEQAQALSALRRLLELDGFTCQEGAQVNRINVPLLVSRDGRQVAVGTQSGLLDESWQGHSMGLLTGGQRPGGVILNEYVLKRNLPDKHQLVRDIF